MITLKPFIEQLSLYLDHWGGKTAVLSPKRLPLNLRPAF